MPDQNLLLPGETLILGVENGLRSLRRKELAANGVGSKLERRRAIRLDPAGQGSGEKMIEGRPIRFVTGGFPFGDGAGQPSIVGDKFSVPVMRPFIRAPANRHNDAVSRG